MPRWAVVGSKPGCISVVGALNLKNMTQIKSTSHNNLFHIIKSYCTQHRYEVLLLSFMLLVFGNTFTPQHRIIGITDIYQNFLVGLFVFYNKKWLRICILGIILITIFMDILKSDLSAFINTRSVHSVLYLIFFVVVAKEVYKEVLYVKNVSRELLAAALCGFVLLCLFGTFLFLEIELQLPDSFANAGEEYNEVLTNLNYFSFVTLLTTGYGDIVPVHLIAKRAVMFIGLVGHFYTVFITSIIIGKYLSAKKE
ncbi:MAG: ion channel [Bacteroidota bacterium]